MRPTAGPRLGREIEKESCLFASLVLPRREGANLKSCPGWSAGAGARVLESPETAHLSLRSPFCRSRRGREGSRFVPRATGLRRLGRARGGGCRGAARGTPAMAGDTPAPRRLSSLPSVRRGFPLRAYCAHAGCPLRAGGRSAARALGAATLPRRPLPLFPGAPGRIRLCFRNRFWGASLVAASPCSRSHAAASSSSVPGARVLCVSSKAVSIYRRRCRPAMCKVSITAMRRARPEARARQLRGAFAPEPRMENALGGRLRASLLGRGSGPVAHTMRANSNGPWEGAEQSRMPTVHTALLPLKGCSLIKPRILPF